MSAEAIAEEFEKILMEVEVEFQNSLDELILVRDLQKLNLPGAALEKLTAGMKLKIFRWASEKLVEKELARRPEELLDPKTIRQLCWKERNNPAELQPLPRYFYLMARGLRDSSNILPELKDIFALRFNKIVSYAAKRVPEGMLENLTAEEQALYRSLSSIIQTWFKFIEIGDESR